MGHTKLQGPHGCALLLFSICSAQVFCDRHFGGINYPRGGVGRIGEALAEGLTERGSHVEYKANVRAPAFLSREAECSHVLVCSTPPQPALALTLEDYSAHASASPHAVMLQKHMCRASVLLSRGRVFKE